MENWQKNIISKKESQVSDHFEVASICVLAMSSVPCKRCFLHTTESVLKFRQKLAVKTFKSLLSISVIGPEPELYDFLEAILHWKRQNNYRHIYSSITSKLL